MGSRSTIAEISCPSTTSGPASAPVLYSETSEPQIPHACTRSRTSSGPGSGTGVSRTTIERAASKNAARIVPASDTARILYSPPHGLPTGSTAVCSRPERWRASGVEAIFALPGGHILPLFEGARREGTRLIDMRHEENAVLMAEGFALATGRVAAAAVTAGPGLANAFAGIAEANAAGVPVVVLAGRTGIGAARRGAVQDLDQLAAVAPMTKWRAECLDRGAHPVVRRRGRASGAVRRPGRRVPGGPAGRAGGGGRAAAASAWPTGTRPSPARSRPVAGDVDRAVALLQSAERPVVLAGSGAFFSGAGGLAAFVERTGIPVITTSAARGLLDDDHPRCLGGLVHGGHRAGLRRRGARARFAVQREPRVRGAAAVPSRADGHPG